MRICVITGMYLTILMCDRCHCKLPDGYIPNKATGHAYKLMYKAQPWDTARDKCKEQGAKLAVPKSEEEFSFLQKIARGIHYPSIENGSGYQILVWLGINNFDNYKTWKNVDGENINDTGFHTWAGHNGEAFSDNPAEPHCVGMDGHNHGLRDWWCHKCQAYICEMKL